MELGDHYTLPNASSKLGTFNGFEIHIDNSDVIFIFAVDQNGTVVGVFEFVEYEGYVQLAHMNVHKNQQGVGVGTEIMRLAVDSFTHFELPSTSNTDMYYFIEDGLPFVMKCFDKEVLISPPFRRPVE